MQELIINKIKTKNILNKSKLPIGDYSVNPYVGCSHACRYCYACFMKKFTNHLEKWGEFIDIKYWDKIKNPQRYKDKEVFIGSVTDPYNEEEKKYKRTRTFLEEMQDSGIKLSIQTKSDLVLRDMDLIKKYQNARVGFSINTLDEEFKDDMDKAVSIKRRLNAMKILHDNGIRTTCFISPIFPEITDVKAIIDEVKDKCNLIWLENLNLRGSFKAEIMQYIKNEYPNIYYIYDEIYNKGNTTYWQRMDAEIKEYANKNNLKYLTNTDIEEDFKNAPTIINFFYHEKIKRNNSISF